ncbi:hypothetical protein ACFLU6_12555, partial [Acidobacteriota bacterium]
IFRSGKRLGFEVKYTDSPRTTKSLRNAKSDLALDSVHIIYPGTHSFEIDKGISALSICDVATFFSGEMSSHVSSVATLP